MKLRRNKDGFPTLLWDTSATTAEMLELALRVL
jgi:hypothetical protein